MKKFSLTIFVLFTLFSLSKTAVASCAVKSSIPKAAKEADVIFTGTVGKIESAQTAGAGLPLLQKNPKWEMYLEKVDVVTFSVSESFKGVDSETIEIVTGADGYAGYKFDGGIWLKEGQTYLVYAYKRSPVSKEIPKKLGEEINEINSNVPLIESNVCTRTIGINSASEELEKVRKIFPNSKRFSVQAKNQPIVETKAETITFYKWLLSCFGLA